MADELVAKDVLVLRDQGGGTRLGLPRGGGVLNSIISARTPWPEIFSAS
jgi:hypothetical protein